MIKMVFQGEHWRAWLTFLLEWKSNPCKRKYVQMSQSWSFFSKKQLCLNKHLLEIIVLLTISLEDIGLEYFWGPDFNVAPGPCILFNWKVINPLCNLVGETGVGFEKVGCRLMMLQFCKTGGFPFVIIHKWHIDSFL